MHNPRQSTQSAYNDRTIFVVACISIPRLVGSFSMPFVVDAYEPPRYTHPLGSQPLCSQKHQPPMSIDGHPNNEITAQSPKLRHFCGLGSQEASKHGCWLVQKYNPLSVGGNGILAVHFQRPWIIFWPPRWRKDILSHLFRIYVSTVCFILGQPAGAPGLWGQISPSPRQQQIGTTGTHSM